MDMIRRRMGGGGGGGFGFGGFGGGFRPPPTMGPPRTGLDRPTGRIERGAWNDPNMMRGRGGGPMGPPGGGFAGNPGGVMIDGGPRQGWPGFVNMPNPMIPPMGKPKPAMVNPRQPMPVNKMPMGMFKQPMKNTVGSVLGGGKPGGTQGSWF
jgi:hypothetical protein